MALWAEEKAAFDSPLFAPRIRQIRDNRLLETQVLKFPEHLYVYRQPHVDENERTEWAISHPSRSDVTNSGSNFYSVGPVPRPKKKMSTKVTMTLTHLPFESIMYTRGHKIDNATRTRTIPNWGLANRLSIPNWSFQPGADPGFFVGYAAWFMRQEWPNAKRERGRGPGRRMCSLPGRRRRKFFRIIRFKVTIPI
jgi:hypothetical protein